MWLAKTHLQLKRISLSPYPLTTHLPCVDHLEHTLETLASHISEDRGGGNECDLFMFICAKRVKPYHLSGIAGRLKVFLWVNVLPAIRGSRVVMYEEKTARAQQVVSELQYMQVTENHICIVRWSTYGSLTSMLGN